MRAPVSRDNGDSSRPTVERGNNSSHGIRRPAGAPISPTLTSVVCQPRRFPPHVDCSKPCSIPSPDAQANAPIDDEPATEEEESAVAEARQWLEHNPGIPFEQVAAELGPQSSVGIMLLHDGASTIEGFRVSTRT